MKNITKFFQKLFLVIFISLQISNSALVAVIQSISLLEKHLGESKKSLCMLGERHCDFYNLQDLRATVEERDKKQLLDLIETFSKSKEPIYFILEEQEYSTKDKDNTLFFPIIREFRLRRRNESYESSYGIRGSIGTLASLARQMGKEIGDNCYQIGNVVIRFADIRGDYSIFIDIAMLFVLDIVEKKVDSEEEMRLIKLMREILVQVVPFEVKYINAKCSCLKSKIINCQEYKLFLERYIQKIEKEVKIFSEIMRDLLEKKALYFWKKHSADRLLMRDMLCRKISSILFNDKNVADAGFFASIVEGFDTFNKIIFLGGDDHAKILKRIFEGFDFTPIFQLNEPHIKINLEETINKITSTEVRVIEDLQRYFRSGTLAFNDGEIQEAFEYLKENFL